MISSKKITIEEKIYDFDEEHDRIRERCQYLLLQMKNCKTYNEYFDMWAEYETYGENEKSYNDFIDFQSIIYIIKNTDERRTENE